MHAIQHQTRPATDRRICLPGDAEYRRTLERHARIDRRGTRRAMHHALALRIGASAVASNSSIVFHRAVTGATVLQAVQGDLGIVLNGSTVSAWFDQSGNGKDYSQGTPAKQPTYNPTGLNGSPTLRFVRTSSNNMTSLLNLPAVGTTPCYIWWIYKHVSWTLAERIFGPSNNGNNTVVFSTGSTPSMAMFVTSTVNTNNGSTIGSWVRGEAWFNNGTSDYLQLGSSFITGLNAGTVAASTGRDLGSANGVNFCDMEIAAIFYANARPNERSVLAGGTGKLDALGLAKYPSVSF